MKNREYGFTAEKIFDVKMQDLEHGEDQGDVLGYPRADVMDEVQKLLDSNFQFGCDPLPCLEMRLHMYKWEYFRLLHLGTRDVMERKDFIWVTHQNAIVTATLPKRSSPLCYVYDCGDYELVNSAPAFEIFGSSGRFTYVRLHGDRPPR